MPCPYLSDTSHKVLDVGADRAYAANVLLGTEPANHADLLVADLGNVEGLMFEGLGQRTRGPVTLTTRALMVNVTVSHHPPM